MDTPVTPKTKRPALGARSHTDTLPKLRTAGQPAQQSKKSAVDLFGNSHHRHHIPFHHSQGKDKRNEDKFSSKTNLRQHLQTPVAELSNIITGNSGSTTEPSREAYGDVPALRVPRRPIKAADVEYEKQKARRREDEMRTSLNKLSDEAHQNTRRLDFAYYSLLEKVRTLRSTIASLQELSTATNELQQRFRDVSTNISTDTQNQIDSFAAFHEQQERVQDLESRIKAGMSKAENLSARLEAARTRVETWEARENQWQAKISQRLTICWWGLSMFVAFIVLLLTIRRLTASPAPKVDVDIAWAQNNSIPSFIVEDLAELSSSRALSRSTSSRTASVTLAGDKRLRALEEL